MNSENIKYYSLEELEVGMEVSILSLSRIVGTAIYLDKKTFKTDSKEIGVGKIVAIGLDDCRSKGLTSSEVRVVSNAFDLVEYGEYLEE